MQLFYTQTIEGDFAYFGAEEARHCVQVLRKKVGDELHFVDGLGGKYVGEIVETGKKTCVLSIKNRVEAYKKPLAKVHLLVAPTKNIARFEWLLEKATEIGVSEITPLLCKRSERKKIREDRLEKILIAAMKQSLNAYLPRLNPLTTFKALTENIAKTNETGQRFIAHCADDNQIHLREKYKGGNDVMILIGPEGDFTAEEIQLAFQNGFEAISLGPNRLRTETAGIAACHTISLENLLKQ